jgi:hypothetical protein
VNKTWQMKITTVTVSLIFAAQPSMVCAIEQVCIKGDEIDALTTVVAPAVINAAVKQCSTVLAKDAYLLQNYDGLIAKFAEKRDAALPLANLAIQKITQDESTTGKVDQAIARLSPNLKLERFQTGAISALKLDAKTCLAINEVMVTLAPLPPENLTHLLTTIVQLSANDSKKKSQSDPCLFNPARLPMVVGSPQKPTQ